MHSGVVVLNASYEVLSRVPVARAVRYVLRDKAAIVHAEPDRYVRAARVTLPAPTVVRLNRYVRLPFTGQVPAWSRRGVLQRDKGICAYCGRTGADSVDHVQPTSRGGAPRSWLNTVAAHQEPCNRKKNDRTPEEAGMRLLWPPVEPRSRIALAIGLTAAELVVLTELGAVVS